MPTQIAPSLYGLQSLLSIPSYKKSVDGKLHANKASVDGRPILFMRTKRTIGNRIKDTFEGKKRTQQEVFRILDQAALKTRNKATLRLINDARKAASKSRSLKDLRLPIDKVIEALERECTRTEGFEPNATPFAALKGIENPLTESNLYGPLLKAAHGNLEPLVESMSTALGQALSGKVFPKQIEILLEMEEKAAEELVNRSPQPLARSVANEIVQKAIDKASKPLFGFVDPKDCERNKDTGKSGSIKGYSTPDNPEPFSRVNMFGDGGFGSAGLYKSGDAEVVLKWPQAHSNQTTSTEDNCGMLREALHQYQAHAHGPDTVMEMKHVVRTPGGWAIAMEAGKLGSLWDVSNALGDDPEARQFLALQVVRIAQTLEASGVKHLDLKEPNIFLLDDATAKLGDFGTATTDERARKLDIPDNPGWFPPDARKVVNSVKEEIGAMEKPLNDQNNALTEKRVKLKNAGKPVDELLELQQNANRSARQKLEPEIQALAQKAEFSSNGVDRWGLGIILQNVLSGKTGEKSPFYAPFTAEEAANFEIFQKAQDQTTRKRMLGHTGRRAEKAPNVLDGQPEPIQNLVLALYDPNPEKRPAPSQIDLGIFNLVANLTPEKDKEIRDRIAAKTRAAQPSKPS